MSRGRTRALADDHDERAAIMEEPPLPPPGITARAAADLAHAEAEAGLIAAAILSL